MKKIRVINGPNLNLLGLREPDQYGNLPLEKLTNSLIQKAEESGLALSCFQSNSESELIDHIHSTTHDNIHFFIINPAAFTHTSIAMRDAILAVNIPFIEVHISNIHARESFRSHSYFSDKAVGIITGLGTNGYFLALKAIIDILNK